MPAIDGFSNVASSIDAPADDGEAVNPSDTVDLTKVCRAIYVGVGGDVNLITKGGNTLLFKNAQSGSTIPVRCSRVKATSTSATNLIALY